MEEQDKDSNVKKLISRPDLDIPFKKPDLSIEECRKILSTDGEEYTDQEIAEIRTLILNFVEIDYKMYQQQRNRKQTEAKVIDLMPEETVYKKAG